MKTILTFSAAFCLIVATVTTAPAVDLDGSMWKSWNQATKKIFLAGFMAATDYISFNQVPSYIGDSKTISLARYSDYADLTHNKRERYSAGEVTSLLNFVRHEQYNDLKRYRLSMLPMDALIHGIDRFYGEYRNNSIKITDTFYFVKRKLDGASEEELQAVLKHLRTPDTKATEIVFSDRRGELGVATFP
ncbi:hypothetical protein [Geobacter argillaceus]|uniref:Uncharacterized protein n=1 Tax=Geobacter argillaceus TaxID=345631 RepID=A0A562VGK6_9BACT|nr:hypothetical protein [Geobacter argillaceus]TWJ17053.1 hypothetical protein JN12_03165 [Geobacter argillaceus]